jgi:hypothetical protein
MLNYFEEEDISVLKGLEIWGKNEAKGKSRIRCFFDSFSRSCSPEKQKRQSQMNDPAL